MKRDFKRINIDFLNEVQKTSVYIKDILKGYQLDINNNVNGCQKSNALLKYIINNNKKLGSLTVFCPLHTSQYCILFLSVAFHERQ